MIIASDIETQGFTKQYLCGSTAWQVSSTKNIMTKTFTTKEEHLNWILEKAKTEEQNQHKTIVYFHNSLFDTTRLFKLNDPNIKIIKRTKPYIIGYGNNINTPQEKVYLIIIDSMPIFAKKLEEVGKMIGTPKTQVNPELEHKHHQETPQNYTPQEQKELQTYCKNDSKVLLTAILNIKENLKKENLRINTLYSAGQIAQKTFNNRIKNIPEKWKIFQQPQQGEHTSLKYIKPKYDKETREASRGARFQVFQLGAYDKAEGYDYNSLYPQIGTEIAFPDLTTEQKITDPLKELDEQTILEQYGVTKCIITIPKNTHGILPIRYPYDTHLLDDEQEYIRLRLGVVYPTKKTTLIGTWVNYELQEAIKRGAKIKAIEHTINWGIMQTNPLKDYMTEMYQKRLNNQHDNWFYKLLMNNLIGKFSQQNDEEEIIYENIDKYAELEQQGYTKEQREGYQVQYVKKLGKTPSNYYAPIISATTYAHARIKMLNQLEKIEPNNILYIANDGIITKENQQKHFDIGPNMGQYKIIEDDQGPIQQRPYYAYGIDNYMLGNNIKLNGIGKNYANKTDFLNGKIKYKQMYTLANAPNIEMVGEFKNMERDLKKTLEKTQQREKILAQQKLIKDRYTDITWFQTQGYI